MPRPDMALEAKVCLELRERPDQLCLNDLKEGIGLGNRGFEEGWW